MELTRGDAAMQKDTVFVLFAVVLLSPDGQLTLLDRDLELVAREA